MLESLLPLIHSHWLHLCVKVGDSLMSIDACKPKLEFQKNFRNPNPTEILSQ